MILIPDSNTLHVIKEGNVSVENVQLRVTTNFTDIKSIEVSFNDDKYFKYTPGMKIPKEYHTVPTIHMKLKMKIGSTIRVFNAQQMPLVVYTMIGERVEDLYPVAIQNVLDREQDIINRIARLEELAEYGNL